LLFVSTNQTIFGENKKANKAKRTEFFSNEMKKVTILPNSARSFPPRKKKKKEKKEQKTICHTYQ
jgi:hypothetical protein